MATTGDTSYINHDTFLSPSFNPVSFANNLVTTTNNASDTTVDLTTPLSRVLFDLQEIDTHIDDLATKSALPLLKYAKAQSLAAETVVTQVDAQIKALTESYQRLELEVVERHAVAEEVRLAASRLWVTVKIGRAVSRALVLGRALEREMAEAMKGVSGGPNIPNTTASSLTKEDHQSLVHAAYTLHTLRALFNATGRDEEGEHLSRINILNTLKTDLLAPSEQKLKTRAQQIVREFSLSSLLPQPTTSTNGITLPTTSTLQIQTTHETKSRTISALQTLYLLSTPQQQSQAPSSNPTTTPFTPTLLTTTLTTYLQAALTSSTASLARALSSLPTLPRALAETSTRCQNILALETLLSTTQPTPKHPLLESRTTSPSPSSSSPQQQPLQNLLTPLLNALDTTSLASYFWRTLSSALAPRVAEILGKGGVAARGLRGAKERVRVLLRDAVVAGVEGAKGDGVGDQEGLNWEREVAVFVGCVLGGVR